MRVFRALLAMTAIGGLAAATAAAATPAPEAAEVAVRFAETTDVVSLPAKPTAFATASFFGAPAELAYLDAEAKKAHILISDVSGGFPDGSRLSFDTYDTPSAIFAGELNNEDNIFNKSPDVAVVHAAAGELRVITRRGRSGTVYGDNRYTVGKATTDASVTADVAAGDFDSDGLTDLAVTRSNQESIAFFYGLGNGTFNDDKVVRMTSLKPTGMVQADLNGDGFTDLVTIHGAENKIAVWLAAKSRDLKPAEYETCANPVAVSIADLNRDWKPDLAVACKGDSSVEAHHNSGTGAFARQEGVIPGGAVDGVGAADFNGDGAVDLAVADHAGGKVRLLSGKGAEPQVMWDIPGLTALVTGDFGDDGRPDLAAVHATGGKHLISVRHNTSATSFTEGQDIGMGGADARPGEARTADFDGDGKPDVAVLSKYTRELTIFRNDGTGVLLKGLSFAAGNGARQMAIANLNNDDHLDIVISNEGDSSVTVLLGDGTGDKFTSSTVSTKGQKGWSPWQIAVGDFNKDGHKDLAVSNTLGEKRDEADGSVSVVFGDGTGAFSGLVELDAYRSYSIAAADFNGDGFDDLVAAQYYIFNSGDQYSGLRVWYGQEGKTFSAPKWTNTCDGPVDLQTGDVDQDKKPDVVMTCQTGVQVFLNKSMADGKFPDKANNESFASGGWSRYPRLSDLDGDGDLDAVITNFGGISFLLNDGTGRFARFGSWAAEDIQITGAGDLNGDNKTDLVVPRDRANTVDILLND